MKANPFKLKMTPKDTAFNLYQECQKLFPCYFWNSEKLKNIKNDRSGDYEIEFLPNVEADEDFKNFSADDLREKFPNDKFITFPERLKLELQYLLATGKHLDVQNVTLCAGSRYSGGSIPCVFWDSGRLYVGWDGPAQHIDNLRSRRAVSASSLTPCQYEYRKNYIEKQTYEKILNVLENYRNDAFNKYGAANIILEILQKCQKADKARKKDKPIGIY